MDGELADMIYIGKAYIEKNGDVTSLCSDIIFSGRTLKMYFEYDNEYSDYICTDYADPFVLMILEYAMACGLDIKCEQSMSDTLYYNLTCHFIPILAENTRTFHRVNIFAEVSPIMRYTGGGVGAGLSCGIDSFNVINRYKNYSIEKYRLTYLFFMNNGQMGPIDYRETKDIFLIEKVHCMKAAEEIGLPLVCVNTNMMELYGEIAAHRANNAEGLKIASAVYGLRGMIKIYYIASTVGLDRFHFSDSDVGFFAPFTANIMSSESCCFLIGDLDNSKRICKEAYISDDPVMKQFLRINTIKNNPKSLKGIRTLSGFYVLGKLENLSQVMNLDNYCKRKAYYFGRNLCDRKEWDFGYNQEIISKAIENKMFCFLILSFMYRFIFWMPALFMKKIFCSVKRILSRN